MQNSKEDSPKLFFDFDIERYGEEIEMKGYCDNVTVQLPNMLNYKICFYDPVRLSQDIEAEIFIAIPHLIIVTSLAKENMEHAVYKAWKAHYFDTLRHL